MPTGIALDHEFIHEEDGLLADQGLRQGMGLNKKKPMPVSRSKRHVGLLVHGQRGRNIEQHQARDTRTVVCGQTVGHTSTPIMPNHAKLLMTQSIHERDQIGSHGAFGIGQVLGIARGLGRSTITTQIRHDKREVF